MVPFGATLLDLDIAHRQAASLEHRERVGLGVIDVDRLAAALGSVRPHAPGAGKRCRAAADAAGDAALAFRPVALIGSRNLEDRHVAEATIGIALGGRQEARQQRGPHVGHVGGDRIGELQRTAAAAEKFRMPFRNEGPGDGFQHAA